MRVPGTGVITAWPESAFWILRMTRSAMSARVSTVAVDKRAAGDVDEIPLRAERIEHFSINQVMRFGASRNDYDEEVAPLSQGFHVGETLPRDVLG